MTARFVGAWDARSGAAGGPAFGAALTALAAARGLASHGLADAAELEPAACDELLAGTGRATVAELARIASALKLRALAFLQQSEILGLEVYASGLDPLFFLPPGTTRHDARIYMREINPRHAVPERDMFARSPALAAIAADPLLDSVARLELELAYLLRTAAFALGGSA